MSYTIKTLLYNFVLAADWTENYQRRTLNILPTFRIEFFKKGYSDEYLTTIQIDWILWSAGICVKRNLE